MNIYVFDSCSLINLFKNYPQGTFPSLWKEIDLMLENGNLTSVQEVYKEIIEYGDLTSNWAKNNKPIFTIPTISEQKIIGDIFSNENFHALLSKIQINKKWWADPFVIAKAINLKGYVVTEEKTKGNNGTKVPDICKHFKTNCINLTDFIKNQNWTF